MAFATRLAGSRLSTGSLNILVQQSSRTNGLDKIRSSSRYRVASIRFAGLQTSTRHTYRHLANSEPPNAHAQSSTRSASSQPSTSTTVPTNAAKPPASAPVALNDAQKVSDREQRLTDWAIVRKLARNIWPSGPGSREIKIRVVGALGLLVAGKVSWLSTVFRIRAERIAQPRLPDSQRSSPLLLQANRRLHERRNHSILDRMATRRIRSSRMYVTSVLPLARPN